MQPDTPKPRGPLLRFFSNPVIGIAGSVASIAGLVLAVYFYSAGSRTRDLRYFVHPAKAVVVKAGQTSRLQITVDGVAVEKDVTAAQVAFWNEGAESIRSEHMLRPLVIRTSGGSRVLEARLRKEERDVANIALDLSAVNDGEVRVNWKILERYDGGIVQLIYFDDPGTSISATATVEGQGDVRAVEYSGSAETYQQRHRVAKTLGYVYLALGIGISVYGAFRARKRHVATKALNEFLTWSPIVVGALTIAMALFVMFWVGAKPGPPFGFE